MESSLTVTTDDYKRGSEHSVPLPADFETLFQEQWTRIFKLLFGILGDYAEAEELALEAFWRLYERPPRIDGKAQLTGWLYRVATNLGFNALRARKRRLRYEEKAGHLELEVNPPLDPERETERSEQIHLVRKVLTKMKPRSAKLLILRYSGLSYAELAAALKAAPGSIGTMLTRAEAEFEKHYRRLEGG